MSSDIVITARGVGKRFRIGRRARYKALRDVLSGMAAAPFRLVTRVLGRGESSTSADFWALRDVSFDLRRGDVVGLIGRNGAGKSTLLKVLSRITEPTVGRIRLHGRVGSLLEVGTGFHPELTGRENIFLNGAILGMRRTEIREKFDQIVDFAEIETFIDTPVKHYSSGMYMRLAFSVAAHLEPEILLVDEVLAVGDADFQKKCLGKMGEVARAGRTVIFVSHNMAAIRKLCTTGLYLERGRLTHQGDIEEAVRLYLSASTARADDLTGGGRTPTQVHPTIIATVQTGMDGIPTTEFRFGDRMVLNVGVRSLVAERAGLEIVLRDQTENPIVFVPSGLCFGQEFQLEEGDNRIECTFPPLPLAEGRYSIDLALVYSGQKTLDFVQNAALIEVVLSDPAGSGWCFTQQTGQGALHLPVQFRRVE